MTSATIHLRCKPKDFRFQISDFIISHYLQSLTPRGQKPNKNQRINNHDISAHEFYSNTNSKWPVSFLRFKFYRVHGCMSFFFYDNNIVFNENINFKLINMRPAPTYISGFEMCSHINSRDLQEPVGRTATISLSFSKYSKYIT